MNRSTERGRESKRERGIRPDQRGELEMASTAFLRQKRRRREAAPPLLRNLWRGRRRVEGSCRCCFCTMRNREADKTATAASASASPCEATNEETREGTKKADKRGRSYMTFPGYISFRASYRLSLR